MKVKILVEFEVEPHEDHDPEEDGEFNLSVAQNAASQAAYDFLSFVKVSGYSTDSEWVEVHVDGFGKCQVSLGEDHE